MELAEKIHNLGIRFMHIPSNPEASELSNYIGIRSADKGALVRFFAGIHIMFPPYTLREKSNLVTSFIRINKKGDFDLKHFNSHITPTIKDYEIDFEKFSELAGKTAVKQLDNILPNNITWYSNESSFMPIKDAKELGKSPIITKTYVQIIEEVFSTYFGKERVDLNGNIFLIHFPEVEIVNSNGEKHTMYDIYIRVRLPDFSLSLTRMAMQRKEIAANYFFSHAQQCHSMGSFQTLCYGSGGTPISTSLTTIRGLIEKINKKGGENLLSYPSNLLELDSFGSLIIPCPVLPKNGNSSSLESLSTQIYLFCGILENYLKWESLEGGPYVTMSQMTRNSRRDLPNSPPSLPQGEIITILARILKYGKDKIEVRTAQNINNTDVVLYIDESIVFENCDKRFIKGDSSWLPLGTKMNKGIIKEEFKSDAATTIRFKGEQIKPQIIVKNSKNDNKPENAVIPSDTHGRVINELNKLKLYVECAI